MIILASKPGPYYYKYNIGPGELRRLLSSFVDIYRRKTVFIVGLYNKIKNKITKLQYLNLLLF